MPWNFMQAELNPAAGRIDPMIGEGGLSRDAAVAAIQDLLDRSSELNRQLFSVAELWRRGAADDTVLLGPFIWCVYDYPEGQDPTQAAMAWLDDFSRRGTGKPAVFSADRPGHTPDPKQHRLEVGKPYSPAVPRWQDGAAELQLQPQGAEFALFLASPKAHEITAFTSGTAEFAVTAADRHLTWSYRFASGQAGEGIPWSDTPWEYHRQAARHPVGVPGKRGTTFLLQLTLVDAATGIVKGLRFISPPADFADTLRDAVDRQQQRPHDPAAAARDIQALYDRYTSADLPAQADARFEAPRDGTTR